MCPASASSASDPLRMPPTTCTTRNAPMIAIATQSRVRFAVAAWS